MKILKYSLALFFAFEVMMQLPASAQCPSNSNTTFTTTDEVCLGDNNGTIDIVFNDGVPPYSIALIYDVSTPKFLLPGFDFTVTQNAPNDFTLSDVPPGIYLIRVNCSDADNVNLGDTTTNGDTHVRPGIDVVANDQTPAVCEDVAGGGTSAVNLTALNAAIDGGAGHTITWYSDAGLTTPVGDPTNETVSTGSVYYAEVDDGTCTDVATVTYTVNASPAANDQTPAPLCEDVSGGGTVAGVNLTGLNSAIDGGAGHTITWYSDAGLTTPVGDPTNVTVSNGSVYYAEVDDGTCTNVATATYTVNSLPAANDQTPAVCEDVAGGGTSAVDLTALNAAIDGGAGHTITWYSDAGLTTPVGDPTNETVSTGSVYYAEVDDGTCTDVATVTYTVNATPPDAANPS
ncbi:MAG: hypothetical protein MI975_01855, partial [Cytophagales bacterium]|nr:hypothetical protein [Cytophagales bacterium]